MNKNWIKIQYTEVVKKISTTNQKIKQKEYLQDGSYPIIDQSQEIVGGHTNDQTKLLKCKLPAIVFGDHTKIVKLINFPFVPGADGIKVLEAKSVIIPKYLFYITKVLVYTLTDKGYARHYQHLEKQTFPLAPLPEQRAIVSKIEELFSELDNGIANLKTAKEKLEIYRQAVLKKAFEGKLTNGLNHDSNALDDDHDISLAAEPEVDYQKNQANQNNHTNQGSDNGLPKGCKWVKLGEVSEIKRGKSKHRPRNDPSLFGGVYPFIQTGDVKAAEGKIIRNYSQTYNDFGLQQSKLWPKGTLCLTIAANIADTAFLGFDACFPDSVVGINADPGILSTSYLNFLIQKLKVEIDSEASATAQKNINVEFLEKLAIPLPSITEQITIVSAIESRLSVCDKLAESIDLGLEKAEALRQSILKKAFEGKLLSEAELEACRKEPDWEPAERLLERIKNNKISKFTT